MMDVPLRRVACVFLLRVFAWAFLRIVAGCDSGYYQEYNPANPVNLASDNAFLVSVLPMDK